MVKGQFHGVSGLSIVFRDNKNPEQSGKRGCAQISLHPCESVASTSDDHNFPVRTPIFTFLDSVKSSLSIEFNRIKFSAKTWAEHWAGSRKVEEWSVMGSGTPVFLIGLYMKCLGLRMA